MREDGSIRWDLAERDETELEDALVTGDESSVFVAEEGVQEEGTDSAVVRCSVVETIMTSGQQLRDETLTDSSVTALRKLADGNKEGYEWKDGLLYRCQENKTMRLCLPKTTRDICLTLAHEQFRHRGYNKVANDLCRLFYWPSLWKVARKHCQGCEVCQRYSKSKPRRVPMCEREVLTMPSEWVCVDMMGPLPKAKGVSNTCSPT